MYPAAFLIYAGFAFFNNDRHIVYFKIICEHFRLITSESLKKPTKLSTRNRIVLRFSNFIVPPPKVLYSIWSNRAVTGSPRGMAKHSLNDFYEEF